MASVSIPFVTTVTSPQTPLTSTWDSIVPLPLSPHGFLASKYPKFGHKGSAEYIEWSKKKIGKIAVARRISNGIAQNAITWFLEDVNMTYGGDPGKDTKVWIAGGSANWCVDPIMASEKKEKSIAFGTYFSPPSDVDVYLVGGNEASKLVRLNKVLDYLEKTTAFYVRSKFTVSAVLTKEGRLKYGVDTFQIILVSADSIDSILSDFDIDCCCVAMTGEKAGKITAVALPRAIAAMKSRINHYNPRLLTWSYAKRISKYISRGYDFYVQPEYEVSHLLGKPYPGNTQNGFQMMLLKGPYYEEIRGTSACYLGDEETVASNALFACSDYEAAKKKYEEGHTHYKFPVSLSTTVLGALKDLKFGLTPKEMTDEASKGVPSDLWPSLKKN